MKRNILLLTAMAIAFGLALFGCKKDTPETVTPKITEDKVEATTTSATFTWKVEWLGNRISVVELSERMDMCDSHFFGSEEELNKEVFTVLVEDLKPGTKYYYRYWVWNQNYVNNKFVMETKNFTTETDMARVKTLEVTDITRTSATGQGEILSDGGLEITECGICWGTSHNPTTSGSHAASSQITTTFSVLMTELTPEETYYVRAYAKNAKGTAYSEEEVWFVTGDAVPPTMTTAQVTDISWRTAIGGGEVTDDGDAMVTERGLCWSTNENPTIEDSHIESGSGTGSFTVDIIGLTAGTTYHVRAYAKNRAGYGYGEVISFTTPDAIAPAVTTDAVTLISYTTATVGGNVTSDGGSIVSKRGICWSKTPNPTYSGTGCHHLTLGFGEGSFSGALEDLDDGTYYYVRSYALNDVDMSYGEERQFRTQTIMVPTVNTKDITRLLQTSANCGCEVVSDGGSSVTEKGICWSTHEHPTLDDSHGTGLTVSMTNLVSNTTYYVRAYAKNSKGTGFGEEKSFTTLEEIIGPTGAINGKFSVSPTKQVWFSQGNLQYQPNLDIWRFAMDQEDYVGGGNAYISHTYNGWIDLFGWGTSGFNHNDKAYQPWSTSTVETDYHAYGSYLKNLYDNSGKADWGVNNAISNGGDQPGLWRTLSIEEWNYLLFERETTSGMRFAFASKTSSTGLLIFPDDWDIFTYSLDYVNSGAWSASLINSINGAGWSVLEQAGCVFLPLCGQRMGTDYTFTYNIWDMGSYWSSSSSGDGACQVYFIKSFYDDHYDYRLEILENRPRCCGFAVRLVQDVN